jgi:hypothetical protein
MSEDEFEAWMQKKEHGWRILLPKKRLSRASVVFGVASGYPLTAGVCGVAAFITGLLALMSKKSESGKGAAIAGIVLGICGFALQAYNIKQETELRDLLESFGARQNQITEEFREKTSEYNSAQTHAIPEHGLRVELPRGWQRMEALSGNTILKMKPVDSPGKDSRIVIVAVLLQESLDFSTVSRDEHIRSLKSPILDESVSVLEVGRTQVGGIDALWGKTHRTLPGRGSTYDFTYEFVREYKAIPKGFTIRLTSYGDQEWFQSNCVVFDRFIQSIVFNERTEESDAETDS